MVTIKRLWSNIDDNFNLILLNRPRISIKVDEYIWGIIEKNIVIPKNIMRSKKYDYELVVSLAKYNPENCRFYPISPYNGSLKENVTTSIYGNHKKRYAQEDFVGGEEKTTWFSVEKFWINAGNKTALLYADSDKINENITPIEYADILFDAFAATLLHNFKKLKKTDFDEVKALIDEDVVCSFPFPASFIEQQYEGDGRYLKMTRGDKIIYIPSVEEYYKKYYEE